MQYFRENFPKILRKVYNICFYREKIFEVRNNKFFEDQDNFQGKSVREENKLPEIFRDRIRTFNVITGFPELAIKMA